MSRACCCPVQVPSHQLALDAENPLGPAQHFDNKRLRVLEYLRVLGQRPNCKRRAPLNPLLGPWGHAVEEEDIKEGDTIDTVRYGRPTIRWYHAVAKAGSVATSGTSLLMTP